MDDRIIELYEKYETCRQVAEELGVSIESVRRVLIGHGISRTHRHPKPFPKRSCPSYCDIDVSEVVKLYSDGKSTVEIGRMMGCSYETVNRRLKEAGVPLRKTNTGSRFHIDREKLEALLLSGKTMGQIAEEIGCKRGVVAERCKEYGLNPGRGNVSYAVIARTCPECGNEYETHKRDQRFCSQKCQNAWFSRKRHDRLRAHSEKAVDDISLREVYERDGGVCHICGRKTDWSDYRLNENGAFIAGKRYPSRDHVIPLAKGGQHSWGNVKLACFSCNSRKSDAVLVTERGAVDYA